MKAGALLGICVLVFCGIIHTVALKRLHKNAEDLIEDICEKLFDEDLQSDENQRWEKLCQNWMKSQAHRRENDLEDENDIDEIFNKQNHQPRLMRSRGGSSRTGIRTGIRTGGGTRTITIGTRYRNSRTGINIIRPPGSLWSRTRYTFLPVSRRYFYRSRSSTNRYTTPATGTITYYYCSTNGTTSDEIQCSSINGDTQCCEDETTHAAFCCGGQVSEDLIDDFNHATKILARIFYTLSAMALFTHILMRRFYR